MRRPFIAASALLVIVGLAGCSAQQPAAPEPVEPSATVTPTPEPSVADTVGWTLPDDCDGLAWPQVQDMVQEYGDVVQETSPGLVADVLGDGAQILACLSGPPASDAVVNWGAARFDPSTIDDVIAAAVAEGFEAVSDELLVDEVRGVRLALAMQSDGLGGTFIDLVGDAALYFGNASEFGAESLLDMADHLGLPTASELRLPKTCEQQVEGWASFVEFAERNDWTPDRMPDETDPDYSLMSRLDYPGTDTTCIWGLDNSDWLQYLSVSRLDSRQRDVVLEEFADAGYVSSEADGHLLLLRDVGPNSMAGIRVDAAIVTDEALVHAEVLDGFDAEQATSYIDEFARSLGVID